MTPRIAVFAGALTALTSPAFAEIYRSVDQYGNVTYSDEASDQSETVEVKPITTITLPKLEDVTQTEAAPEADATSAQPYDSIRFVSPGNDTAFHSGNGDVEFQVSSSPALREGHLFEIALDGAPVGQSSSGSVMVRNVFRGTHQADVHVINSDGVRVQSGNSISFTIHRPSAQN